MWKCVRSAKEGKKNNEFGSIKYIKNKDNGIEKDGCIFL